MFKEPIMANNRILAPSGMVVTPHHLASESALAVLREGGTAMEAMVAAAATIAVVYPHMNSIGGDSFWLIVPPNGEPVVIEACGVAGSLATKEFYKGEAAIPSRGPKSAVTVAGTVAGWHEALTYVTECGYRRLSTKRLLADAVAYAEHGFPVSSCQVEDMKTMEKENKLTKDISKYYFVNGKIPEVGQRLKQPELARTLKHLSENGLSSFYTGELAKKIARDMEYVGMPITEEDLSKHKTLRKKPMKLDHRYGKIYNLPPPTQGIVALAILGILEKTHTNPNKEADFIHKTVEATKQSSILQDQITDPKCMGKDLQTLISSENLYKMAMNVTDTASSQGKSIGPGDTVWMGVMDKKGFAVSFIQSIYYEFGSGVVLPSTGILWHNRGITFTLDDGVRSLEPGKKPFHTLIPAAAKLSDGSLMILGSRGGDGQPQIQAEIFYRYVVQGMSLQDSISAPRWVQGKIKEGSRDCLNIEGRFSEDTIEDLKKRGHDIEVLPDYSAFVGQAGALVRHVDGMIEGAYDPRSNGSAVGY